jgi:two-component system OmpR family sensor kinase
MRSIRGNLVLVLMAAAFGIVALGALVTYRIARQQVDAIFDYQLRQVALSVGDRPADMVLLPSIGVPDPELDLVIQIWSAEGITLYFSHRHQTLPSQVQLGYADVVTPQGGWRVFALPINGRIIQVAQPMAVRRRHALDAALRILLPSLALLPALAVGIWIAVGRGLRPLRTLAAALTDRRPTELGRIALPAPPAEIAPVLAALNDLLARLEKASSAQRAFLADAAHELRTPLTALRLQAQLAARAADDGSRVAAIADVQRGLDRMTRIIEQLLTLARQEPDALQTALLPVDLAALAHAAIAGHAGIALDKDIDLGATRLDEAVRINGDAAAIAVLIDNLLDNAVRYTPAGGRIDTSVGGDDARAFIEVADSGPGIPAEDRPHVFDRFYRGRGTLESGSGLGLAIARAIADRHGATIDLRDSALGGLAVRITFPAAALPTPATAGLSKS